MLFKKGKRKNERKKEEASIQSINLAQINNILLLICIMLDE